jgi:hypothetical protein
MKRLLLLASVYLTLLVGLMAIPLSTSIVSADAQSDICNGVGAASGGGGCTTNSGPSLTSIVAAVVNILSIIVGLTAVIMIMVAGFQYVTSAGDSGKISGAKGTITYAIVGLIVVAFSQAIVKFVLNKAGI